MDNQQGKNREIDLAWLAGFFDGEGCLDFQRYNDAPKRVTTVNPRARITNTHIPSLDIVTGILDEIPVGYHVEWRYPTNGNKPSWTLGIVGYKRVLTLLQILAPLMVVKQRRAESFIDFCQWKLRQDRKTLTPEVFSARLAEIPTL